MTEDEYRRLVVEKGYKSPVEKSWAPGHANDTHHHDFPLFLFVSEGKLILDVDGEGGVETTTFKPGETLEMAAGVTHAERAGNNGARFLVARK